MTFRKSLPWLTDSGRSWAGRRPVLMDQEGGRVQRLGPPHWPAYPPGAVYGDLYDRDRDAGLARGLAGRAADRCRSAAARHHCGLPAALRMFRSPAPIR